MSTLGGIVKPMADMAAKTAKAGRVKSVKLKVKMDNSKGPQRKFTDPGAAAPDAK